jgi:hypothetical protein
MTRPYVIFALGFTIMIGLWAGGFIVWCIVEAVRGWWRWRRPLRLRYRDIDPAVRHGQFQSGPRFPRDYK